MRQTAQSARRQQPEQPQPKPRPTHRLYQVTGNGDDAFWREIGAAWPNKDGHGFSISYNVIPLHGRIVMRRIRERAEDGGQQ
ncbi:MAG: hypothetical protein WBR13_00465 [Allosphingosinicella sp.]